MCSLLALVLFVVLMVVLGLTPENRADVAAIPRWFVLVMMLTFWVPTAALVLAFAVVFLGLALDQEQALYLTAVGLGLLQAALHLLVMVFYNPTPSATI